MNLRVEHAIAHNIILILKPSYFKGLVFLFVCFVFSAGVLEHYIHLNLCVGIYTCSFSYRTFG